MLFLKKGSDTLVVVVHEIYGINNHIKDVCLYLSEKGFDVVCPNLLNTGRPFGYSEEDSAYSYFINNVGFESSKNKIMKLLGEFKSRYKNRFVIGYSVGATIAWLCGGEEQCCHGVIGYYGSRIRDYVELNPKCPVLLFFPGKEISFDVNSLIQALGNKDKTKVYRMSGGHGFCDPYSRRYCNESCEKAKNLMLDFLMEGSWA
ncbi:dienelactone hydrolase [Desulfocucumis palustris]|uniref:Dienelactone hydrolase n=1 Tax=Desulfocucumis palustris TaxID=1898651 RepID=A0A2L2XEW8_9FIRM|nr:dienelactone hydrolase family protein [Desulfocucumis palustris]GBF32371.1 dienelactone hydrolase [Desulfocucumis palustris]